MWIRTRSNVDNTPKAKRECRFPDEFNLLSEFLDVNIFQTDKLDLDG